MKLLLDTHLLLWALEDSPRLSAEARALIGEEENILLFSAISMAEVAIKSVLRRPDFDIDPHVVRRTLIDDGYLELPLTAVHAVGVAGLPPIHKDPFDRLLVAQAMVEGITLLSADAAVADYGGIVRRV
ncbi:type II toxin-antitoxin system VapC family toxin [Sphingomonas oligophenolica]|uniref:Type II toxin-antitoxin system VapC family toxin n=1 Tax=Sphingomonas oligophenolica TaxID=301154 RepID=A0ABU9Y1J5_9SPHN